MTEIKEHMEVIGADGVHVGTVDKIEGNWIKLTKKDSGESSHKGHHHYIDRGRSPTSRATKCACLPWRRCGHDGRGKKDLTGATIKAAGPPQHHYAAGFFLLNWRFVSCVCPSVPRPASSRG